MSAKKTPLHHAIDRALLRDRLMALRVAITNRAPDTPFWMGLQETLVEADKVIDSYARDGV